MRKSCKHSLAILLSCLIWVGSTVTSIGYSEDEADPLAGKIQAEVKIELKKSQDGAGENAYQLPVLIGTNKQTLVSFSQKEQEQIGSLFNPGYTYQGVARIAALATAKAEGFKDYTWKAIHLVYADANGNRQDCAIRTQDRWLFHDHKGQKNCELIDSLDDIQFAYVKFNSYDVAFSNFMTIIEKTGQVAGIVLPLALTKK